MNDFESLIIMLARANIQFKTDSGHDWSKRIVLDGDRCLVFDPKGGLAGIRSEDDSASFDED